MAGIFSDTDKLPIDQILDDAAKRAFGPVKEGSEGGIEQRLDQIIVLLGKLLGPMPKDMQILPKIYKIKLSQANTDAYLGLSKAANSITFLKPDYSFTVKLQLLINGSDVIMTESKTIPSGRDTKIDGCIISDIIYTNSANAGANDVEVTAVWI